MSDPTDISNSAAVSDLLAGLRRDLQAAAAGDQPAPFPTPPPRLTSAAISIAVSCAQNAIAADALAKLTTNLHTLGAPVPALTHRQARGLWLPFAMLVAATVWRAHRAVVASRRHSAQLAEHAEQRKAAAARAEQTPASA